MKRILAFSGSLSNDSINHKLVTYVSELFVETEVIIVKLADYPAPLYSKEEEQTNGVPANIQKLHELFSRADAFLISTPEYNSSIPGGFKNILDWISRMEGKIFQNKPTLLMSTSPGGRGGSSVLSHLSTVFPYWGADLIATFSLPMFHTNFGEAGLTNEYQNELLKNVEALNAKLFV
ncbi:NADPH-dependent FMN reductase [Bacteroidota bacterium]